MQQQHTLKLKTFANQGRCTIEITNRKRAIERDAFLPEIHSVL